MNQLLNPNGRFEIFNYQNLGKVRVQVDNQGNPWFCLSDVCQVLGISDSNVLTRRLHPKGACLTPTPTNGGIQNMVFVDEGNLYMAIGRSRKPEAQPFMEWIFREVIPMIRRTGMYLDDDTLNNLKSNPRSLGELITNYENEVNSLRNENKELQARLEAYDSYAREKDGQINELWDKLAEYEDVEDEEDY